MSDRNWIDTAIEAGSVFDWITPGLALLSGNTVLAVPTGAMVATKESLIAAGISVHHEQLFGEQYCFTVKPSDFERALEVLGAERRRDNRGALWVWTLIVGAGLAAAVVLLGGL